MEKILNIGLEINMFVLFNYKVYKKFFKLKKDTFCLQVFLVVYFM